MQTARQCCKHKSKAKLGACLFLRLMFLNLRPLFADLLKDAFDIQPIHLLFISKSANLLMPRVDTVLKHLFQLSSQTRYPEISQPLKYYYQLACQVFLDVLCESVSQQTTRFLSLGIEFSLWPTTCKNSLLYEISRYF